MIIWLASYPKSGNTWVRSFLNSLLFNKNNEADLSEISKIDQYPKRSHFVNLVDEIDNLEKLSSNWIESQKILKESLIAFDCRKEIATYINNNIPENEWILSTRSCIGGNNNCSKKQ